MRLVTSALSIAVALAVPCASRAALDPATAKCIATKLKAAGKLAQGQLTCDSKAVGKGEPVDPTCLTKAADKLVKAFAKAETPGGCATIGDGQRVVDFLAGSRRLARAGLVTTPAASQCTAMKLKSAAKRAGGQLKTQSKAFKKGDASTLPTDVAKTADKFTSDYAKAETKGDCQTTGDAADMASRVDAGLDGVLASLAAITAETVSIPSGAEPAETPGSGSTDASGYPKMVTQFGTAAVDLNRATYTRHHYQADDVTPDAILILIPGFEGGAHSFKVLAENLIGRALEQGTRLEVWAFDRRGHQLEDLVGQDLAEADLDAQLLVDWYFGGELGLTLDPRLPGRRAIFHDAHADTPFIGNWTFNVIIRDIDAVVEAARAVVGDEVFLGGHSAGTGFTARYASTDFDLSSPGVDAGYAKLRGLVLLEGSGGSSTTTTPPTAADLDRIEDRADGGLFAAIRDDAPRCVDGTPCTVATEAVDCAGKGREKCIEPTSAYAIVPGLLNPRILAAGEITAVQAVTDPNGSENLVGVDQGAPGNNPVAMVADLSVLSALGTTSALGGLGAFVDDDNFISGIASFVATSTGATGPVVSGLTTWQPITEPSMPAAVLPNNGPAPTALPAVKWGVEVEVTRMDRLVDTFFAGGSNFTDWYYPSGGLSTTSGLPSLDSSALSVGRSRPDIDNVTEAANVDIPVICFGDSNGLAPVPGTFRAFAESIGTCVAPACDGVTDRVVDPLLPNPAFPTYGDVDGGFEVHIIEGTAHVDVGTGEDDPENPLVGPLLAFIERNRG
jgi:pimeloyl-ACP methyl ester carboxylesterase